MLDESNARFETDYECGRHPVLYAIMSWQTPHAMLSAALLPEVFVTIGLPEASDSEIFPSLLPIMIFDYFIRWPLGHEY